MAWRAPTPGAGDTPVCARSPGAVRGPGRAPARVAGRRPLRRGPRLAVSSTGRYLLSAGWLWHPWGVLDVWDLEAALHNAAVLDYPVNRSRRATSTGRSPVPASWATTSCSVRVRSGTPRSQGRSGRTVLPGGRRRRRASSGLWPSTRHPGTCCRWVASSRSTATRAGTTRAAVQSGSSGRSWRPAPRTRRSPGTRRSPARPGWLSTSAVIGSHTHRRPAGHRHPLGCVNARTGVRRWHSGAEEERGWTRRCSSRRGARCTAWPSW